MRLAHETVREPASIRSPAHKMPVKQETQRTFIVVRSQEGAIVRLGVRGTVAPSLKGIEVTMLIYPLRRGSPSRNFTSCEFTFKSRRTSLGSCASTRALGIHFWSAVSRWYRLASTCYHQQIPDNAASRTFLAILYLVRLSCTLSRRHSIKKPAVPQRDAYYKSELNFENFVKTDISR